MTAKSWRERATRRSRTSGAASRRSTARRRRSATTRCCTAAIKRLFDAPRAYESVTPQDIQKLAAELLRPSNRTVGVLTSAAAPRPAQGEGRMKPLRRSTLAAVVCCSHRCVLGAAATASRRRRSSACNCRTAPSLLLMERHDVPLIAFNAVVRGGAVSDPDERAPARASLLAGLLRERRGLARRGRSSPRPSHRSAGRSRPAPAPRASRVSGSFLARDQKLMVELLADMLQRPRLEQAQFETLRARQIEFIRAAKDSDLAALTPIYGAVVPVRRAPVRPFGRRQRSESRGDQARGPAALLPGAGRRRPADRRRRRRLQDGAVEAALSRAFSGWRKAGAALPPIPKAGARGEPPRAAGRCAGLGAVLFLGRHRRRRRGTIRAGRRSTSTNTLFGGRFTSMLNTELRIRTGLSYGASSQLRPAARRPATGR